MQHLEEIQLLALHAVIGADLQIFSENTNLVFFSFFFFFRTGPDGHERMKSVTLFLSFPQNHILIYFHLALPIHPKLFHAFILQI